MSTKQKLFAGLASLTLFDIAAASAADMPVKAPAPPPAAVYNWAGFYIGAHAGYRWADAQFTGPAVDFNPDFFAARNDKLHPNGGIVGVHVGYNAMLSPNILAGIEGDWTWGSAHATVRGTAINDGNAFYSSELKLGWQATIRGRLGVTNGPWLFYATGGVAFIDVKWSETARAFGSTDGWALSKTRTGWTVGGGIEYMLLNPNWLVRVEYLYENFGSFNVPFGIFGPQVGKLELDAHKLRAGISYKFGGGPVIARY